VTLQTGVIPMASAAATSKQENKSVISKSSVFWTKIDYVQNVVHNPPSETQRFIVGNDRRSICKFSFYWQLLAEYARDVYFHEMKWDLPVRLKRASSTATVPTYPRSRNDFVQISNMFMVRWQLLVNGVPVYKEDKHVSFTFRDENALIGSFKTHIGLFHHFADAACSADAEHQRAYCTIVIEFIKLPGDDAQNTKLASAFKGDECNGKEEWYIDTQLRTTLPTILTSSTSIWQYMQKRTDVAHQQSSTDVFLHQTKTHRQVIALSQRIAIDVICPPAIWIGVKNANHVESLWNWTRYRHNFPVMYGDSFHSAPKETLGRIQYEVTECGTKYVHVPRLNIKDMARALGTHCVVPYVKQLDSAHFNPASFVKQAPISGEERKEQESARVFISFTEQNGVHVPACALKASVLHELFTLLRITYTSNNAVTHKHADDDDDVDDDVRSFSFILDNRGGAKDIQAMQKMLHAWWRILENNMVDMLKCSSGSSPHCPAMWMCNDREDSHDEVSTTCIFVYDKATFQDKMETFLRCITKATIVYADE